MATRLGRARRDWHADSGRRDGRPRMGHVAYGVQDVGPCDRDCRGRPLGRSTRTHRRCRAGRAGNEFGGRNLDAPKDYGTLRVVVRNAGRGPALNVYGYVFVATKAFAKRTGLVTVGNVAPEESATVDILVAPNVDTSGSSQRCASSWVTRTLPVVGITPSFDSPIPAMVNADTATPIGNRSRRTEPRSATAKR